MRRFNPEKELYKIQYGRRNKIFIGAFLILLIISISSTYALYQVRYSKRIIYTKVAPFNNKDIELAIYLDDAPSTDNLFPEKNSGYLYSKTVCDNGSKASFDNVNWELNLKSKGKDKCDVYFVTNKGEPNPPELYQGLIPVTFGDNGKVLVANSTNNDWYNYDDHIWANAVLVNSTKYSDLMYNGSIKEEKYGTEINMSDILQMYVWIPRYKYQLFNVNNDGVEEQEIQIQFESGTASTGDASCTIDTKGKEICENADNGNWYTHPAFKFGTTDLTGIWVGKFGSSGNANALTIKPNITSLRNINVITMFTASRNIEEANSAKFNLNKDEVDTHVMKNMEWGAMAYLTHSKYGRCDGQGSCTEVAMNTRSDRLTGYNGTTYAWDTTNGQLASTTGNIYGIYDTNGESWDYMMTVVMMDAAGSAICYSDSGFTVNTMPDKKYYELYEYGTAETSHQRGHLGDATRETLKIFGNREGGWYDDYAIFPFDTYSWFIRGGDVDRSSNAGTFASSRASGGPFVYASFRVVLTSQDGST